MFSNPDFSHNVVSIPSQLRCFVCSVLVLTTTGAWPTMAEVLPDIPFTVDSSQSYVTLSGNIDGLIPFQEQSPGSLTTSLEGTLNISLTQSAGVLTDIELSPPTSVQLVDQPGPFAPFDAPAELAAQVFLGQILASAAYRNTAMTLSGTTAIDPSGEFPLGGIAWSASTFFDAGAPPLLDAMSYPNTLDAILVGMGSIVISNNTATLTIPLFVFDSSDSNDLGLILNQTFSGVIVATAAVPEPSSWILAMSGCALFVSLWGRQRVAAASRPDDSERF